ncbi:MAG: tRNA pseudouridine(55) synthase TruB [Acidobacteria bacterium]|nr:tRNA pseudouridine(55) synthase TruB [Acidobacteriota bacterium]
MDGVIVVDKPEGWTSHDAVNRLRRLAGTRKIGHLGTLDPQATGVLPLILNRATRLAQFYVRNDKVYDALIHFGYSTDTYDKDGTPTSPVADARIDQEELERALINFRGPFEQVPPPISAKKIGGTPAYKLARRQLPVDLAPVRIEVYSLVLLEHTGSEARLKVHCSGGTYLRSIAHDLGKLLGCGAFLKGLRRIASGDFTLDQARTLDQLAQLAGENRLSEALIPAARLLPEFPTEVVDAHTAARIRQGRDFRVSPFRVRSAARHVKAVTQDGQLIAIGEAVLPHLYHPSLVL